MGLIEIILTVIAWNRGWRWKALIPIGIGFFIGVLIGLSGQGVHYAYLVDFIIILALLVMALSPNKK